MAYETTKNFSGNAYVDGVLWGHWGGTSSTSASKWSSNSLTYSFSGYWSSAERAAVENALDIIDTVSGLNFSSSGGSTDLTFNQYSGGRNGTLGYAYPPDPYWGTSNTGNLYFNDSYTDYWNASTLSVGGVGFTLLIHELGHALGLGHPHDNSHVLPGVSSPYDAGDHKLNQNVYTVMSYNEVGMSLEDGTPISPYALTSYGYQTLGAFDIAALQHLYGASSYNTGSNIYVLPDSNTTGTHYTTIWDTGGDDAIRYGGARNVEIDLRAATLDAADGMLAGGAVSKADGVYGGITIANGVVIENASGGSGDDRLTGNAVDNVLQGNAGNDILDGGAGNDTASYAGAVSGVVVNLVSRASSGADGNDTLVSIENITGSAYADTLTGDDGDNILQGGEGNDALNGGGGTDTASYVDANGGVTVFLARGSVTGADGTDALSGIENVAGSDFDDVFVVGAAGTVFGNDGHDTLQFEDAGAAVTMDVSTGVSSGGANVVFSSIEVFIGSAHDDVLLGDAGADTLMGGDGADVLMGRGGNDMLIGGAGADFVFYTSATGAVSVDLSAGFATGADGADTLSEIENIRGSAFGDNLVGSADANTLMGGDGDDTLEGRDGNDALFGGLGRDTASYENASGGVIADVASGQASGADGDDTLIDVENLIGSDHADVLRGDDGDNLLSGRSGNDALFGGDGGDTLDGGDGDDLLDGGSGDDTLTGGSGDDIYIVDSLSDVVIEVSNGGFDVVRTSLTDYQLADHLESLEFNGTSGDANLVGNAGANRILGGAGNDMLQGGMGGDLLEGGSGTDAVTFASATVQVAVDLIFGGVGGEAQGDVYRDIENIIGSAHDDSLTGDGGVNGIQGGSGNDWLNGRGGADRLFGDAGDDFLWGDAGDDELSGGDGSDTLVGGWGADRLDGGDGLDTLTFQWSGPGIAVDLIYGGVGGEVQGDVYISIEHIVGSAYNDFLTGDTGSNELYGGAGDDWLGGRDGSDLLMGEAGADMLWGGNGDDTLRGGDGDDLLVGGWGADYLDGGDGVDLISFQWSGPGIVVDLIFGGVGGEVDGDVYVSIENVTGSAYNDELTGDDADNALKGGAGDDWLSGRGGADTLSGDSGDDLFVFGDGHGSDVVQDFQAGAGSEDRIDLRGVTAVSDFDELLGMATQTSADTVLDFGDGDTITLIGVDRGALHADDFVF